VSGGRADLSVERGSAEHAAERGSAVVDFVLVSSLICLIVLALLQLAFALHVRNTLTWCASEGARSGARSGATTDQAVARARELITASLSASYAQDVTAVRRTESGVSVVEVTVRGPLPVLALWGPPDSISTSARSFAEDQ